MFFALPVFIYSLLFLLGLEVIVFWEGGIIAAVIILTVISFLMARKIGKRTSCCIIPSLFALSSLAMLYLIDSFIERQVFVLLSASLYYLGLLGLWRLKSYDKDQTARGMIAASATTVVFFFYTASYGIYLNFLIPLWILMLSFFIVTTAVAYQYLRIINDKKRIVWSYSIALGMVMAEVAWVINFWPFGYLTTGVIVLMLYYVFWDLIQSYFLNILSKKRVVANMVFFSLLITLILFTSRWLPVV